MEKSFETAIGELEKIVEELESGEKPLEESIKSFEEGMKLSKYCDDILTKAEKRIVQITEENGEIVETPITCDIN